MVIDTCLVREDDAIWYLDSRATRHVNPHKDWFIDYKLLLKGQTIFVENDAECQIKGIDTISILLNNGVFKKIINVFYVPRMAKNLLSVQEFRKVGFGIHLGQDIYIEDKHGKRVTHLEEINGLFKIGNNPKDEKALTSYSSTDVPKIQISHERLGHIRFQKMKDLKDLEKNIDFTIGNLKNIPKCEACLYGKQSRKKFPNNQAKKALQLLELIHSDLVGPLPNSLGGSTHFITFIDDLSRFTSITFLKAKSEALEQFKIFNAWTENQTQKSIKSLRSDNGGEYISKNFKRFCEDHGISRQFTIPYTPQQNGVVERKNHTFMEVARSMLMASNLDAKFWAKAISTSCYLQNIIPTKVVKKSTPYELWYGFKPSYTHLHIFGCKGYAKIPNEKRHKLYTKTKKCIFIGYNNQSKG